MVMQKTTTENTDKQKEVEENVFKLLFTLFLLNFLLVKIKKKTLTYLANLRIFVSFVLIHCIFSAIFTD